MSIPSLIHPFGRSYCTAMSSFPENVRCVTPTGAGARNGRGWDNAYGGSAGIRAALAELGGLAGGEIWLSGGTYTFESAYNALDAAYPVALVGGFAGYEATKGSRIKTRPSGQSKRYAWDYAAVTLIECNSDTTFRSAPGLEGVTISHAYEVSGMMTNCIMMRCNRVYPHSYSTGLLIRQCTWVSLQEHCANCLITGCYNPTTLGIVVYENCKNIIVVQNYSYNRIALCGNGLLAIDNRVGYTQERVNLCAATQNSIILQDLGVNNAAYAGKTHSHCTLCNTPSGNTYVNCVSLFYETIISCYPNYVSRTPSPCIANEVQVKAVLNTDFTPAPNNFLYDVENQFCPRDPDNLTDFYGRERKSVTTCGPVCCAAELA